MSNYLSHLYKTNTVSFTELAQQRTADPQTESTDAQPASKESSAAVPVPSVFKSALGDKQDLMTLGQTLTQIAARLGEGATARQVQAELTATLMELHADSSYPKAAGSRVAPATFISSIGLPLPTDHFSLTGLAKSVSDRAMEHPLGDLSGALSWPVPLNADEQTRLRAFTQAHPHHLGSKLPVSQTAGGILEFLRVQHPLPAGTVNDPAKLLNALLDSPQARLMGKTLQEHMQGLSTPSSEYDYLLAAITVYLDPESINPPVRNTVAGFDLGSPEHFGKPASAVLERLSQHLVSQGKTSVETAKAGAHLLLAGRAPVFLIKDIPDRVTYGSPAWVNLAVAAATIEAQTPGKVANMSFTQVMLEARSASVADPAVTASAQKAALLDWALANGVVAKKADNLYTAADLTALIDAFNARTGLMTSAVKALDTELPSRREMALAELKKRFPGQEAVFEKKSISVATKQEFLTEGGIGVRYPLQVTGQHSMLDVAMMDLEHPDLVFRCNDPSIPIEALNANKRFGVRDEFDQQLTKGLEDKKTAAATTIKHLISQLPLEDRENFEYGTVSFFQNTSYKQGLGFMDYTPLPVEQELLVRVERDGVITAYEIDFKKGRITHAQPWQASIRERRDANVVHQTKTFGATLQAPKKLQPAGSVPDTFNSDRTQTIADVFVKHLDLDNPEIKAQAKGLTTEDKREQRVDGINDFLLNLVPFRSAIVNFQKGQYGDGAFDLALDVFGFLTAGAGTVGKAVKIGSSAVSAATKAFKVAKVIGAATFSALNPLSGFADIAEGGVRLAAKGVNFLTASGVKAVNMLRGATGSYDLLKASSKQFGVAATGTYHVAGVGVEGGAVLQNGKWYAFDSIKKQPYGGPRADFTPTTIAGNGEINSNLLNWLSAVVAPNPSTPELHTVFREALETAKRNDVAAYNRGMASGNVENVPGYYSTMMISDLKELAVTAGRTPEEIGALAKLIQTRQARNSVESAKIFKEEIVSAGGQARGMPQNFYLSEADLASKGECAALANTMALAIQRGLDNQLIDNFFKASVNSPTPLVAEFRRQLNGIHQIVRDNFHGNMPYSKMPYTEIIDNLRNATTSHILKISTKDHGLLAGVTINGNQKEWFFFDPNFGLAKFPDEASMQRGLELTLNSGRSGGTLTPVAVSRGVPEYDVSTFSEGNFMMSVPEYNPFALFNRPL